MDITTIQWLYRHILKHKLFYRLQGDVIYCYSATFSPIQSAMALFGGQEIIWNMMIYIGCTLHV